MESVIERDMSYPLLNTASLDEGAIYCNGLERLLAGQGGVST